MWLLISPAARSSTTHANCHIIIYYIVLVYRVLTNLARKSRDNPMIMTTLTMHLPYMVILTLRYLTMGVTIPWTNQIVILCAPSAILVHSLLW